MIIELFDRLRFDLVDARTQVFEFRLNLLSLRFDLLTFGKSVFDCLNFFIDIVAIVL